jgi:hypothetical protein
LATGPRGRDASPRVTTGQSGAGGGRGTARRSRIKEIFISRCPPHWLG